MAACSRPRLPHLLHLPHHPLHHQNPRLGLDGAVKGEGEGNEEEESSLVVLCFLSPPAVTLVLK